MKKILKKGKIVVAMSGGVDSSVAAALLKKAGFDVVGIFMKFWNPSEEKRENSCCSIESEKMARLIAKQIDIPFYVLNAEKEFKKKVVDCFLNEYKKGVTPNPCVVCNKDIKFGFLIKKALALGADFVATGHYLKTKDGKLFRSKDKEKDQSYFLWRLSQNQVNRVMFPSGNYKKSEVRKIAKNFKLPVAESKESQEICFIQTPINEFLKKYLKTKPGNILNKEGKVVGKHEGLHFYTIGQRRGINVSQGPYYVIDKDFKKNVLIVSKDPKDLKKKELIAKDVNWISGKAPVLPLKIKAKIRYRHNLVKVVVRKITEKKFKVIFEKPQVAITPGQSVVFYNKEQLLGGGIIE